MEAVPSDLTLLSNKRSSEGQVSFVDKFVIPQNSVDEFIRQMNYNRNFIKQQPGLVKSERYDQKDENGNLTILTVAVWQNQESLEKAKGAIQREFKRIGFNPQEFYKRLYITMERDMYVIA